jgi:hypothetical protein
MGAFQPVVAIAQGAPVAADELATAVFGNHPRRLDAAKGLVRAISLSRIEDPAIREGVAPLPLRLHYFFHHAGRSQLAQRGRRSDVRVQVGELEAISPPRGKRLVQVLVPDAETRRRAADVRPVAVP